MKNDFRTTSYCEKIDSNRIQECKKKFKDEHPRIKNFHRNLIGEKNKDKRKVFFDFYNRKCAYCGVTTEIEGIRNFEVDHFNPQSNEKNNGTNHIDNLVCSCKFCNRKKWEHRFDESFHPDKDGFGQLFFRNERYEIIVSEESNAETKNFHKILDYENKTRKLDYSIMLIIGIIAHNNDILSAEKRIKLEDIKSILINERNNIL